MGKTADGRPRQAEFRSASKTISEAGRAPSDTKGRNHGHLLALGCEDENLYPPLRGEGGARRFFAERGIKWWRSGQSGDPKDHDGPTRNLASSQIACVNFLMPVATDRRVLLSLLRSIDGDVADVAELRYAVPGSGLEVATPVEFEWIGRTTSLEGRQFTRGANVTSADALIVANTDAGRRRAYLLEWKYVEEYPEDEYLGAGSAGETRRKRYGERYAASPLFNGNVPLDELLYDPFYQIVRLGLLADKMIGEQEFCVAEARVVVACPLENVAYRERVTSPPLRARFPEAHSVDDVAKRLWRDSATFRMTAPEALFQAVRGACLAGPLEGWVTYMSERYGWA